MQVADLFAKLSLKPDKGSFVAGDRLIRGIKQGLVALGVFQGVRFFQHLISDTIELGDELQKVSDKFGISTTALQELEFAAARSDVEFEQLTSGLKFLSKNAFQARNGSKALQKSFGDLGISAADLRKQSPDELLMSVAAAFESMPEAERVGRAIEIFGKPGDALVPFLAKGPKAIAAIRKEAQKLGAVISPEQVKQLADADDELKTFKFTLRGIKSELALGLLPIVRMYLEKLQKWIGENRALISQRVEQFINGVERAASFLAQAFDYLVANADEVTLALKVFAGAWLAVQLAGVAAAAATLAAWLPVITAITAAFAAYKVLKGIDDEEAEGPIESAVDDYTTRAERKGSALEKLFHRPSDALADFFVQTDQDNAIGRSDLNPFRSGANRGANARAANAEIDAALNAPRRVLGTPMLPNTGHAANEGVAQSITNNNNTITVNSPNADPKVVAEQVVTQFETLWRRVLPATQ